MNSFANIGLGTYVRTTAIDELVHRFLREDSEPGHATKKQIISLGAGSDTRAFRIFSKKPSIQLIYHELDFSVNTSAKIKAIRASPLLQRAIKIDSEALPAGNEPNLTGDSLHLHNYHIHPIDLRTLEANSSRTTDSATNDSKQSTQPYEEEARISLPGIDPTLPTLLISECCLIYLAPTAADAVIDYFTASLFPPTTPLGLIIYEPIRPDDAFGKTMVSNLATRGIQLQTLHRYSSLPAQRQRLVDHGLGTGQGAVDIDFIWSHWIADTEKERVAAVEILDEIEEWRLLAQHYCVAWGWRDGGDGSFALWRELRSE